MLGDLGADIVKVEQPGVGDPTRTYEPKIGDSSAFTWVVDRNKRSIAVDLRHPRGVDVIHRLAVDVDVAIESFRPGVANRLGVGYDDLRAVNPALVYCSLSGYGGNGPAAREPGHDLNYMGRAGVLSIVGACGETAIPGIQVADLAGGALMAATGLLAALVCAQRTGEGDHIDISMTDGAFALMSIHVGAHLVDGRIPGAGTELLNGAYPCYQVYTCADGRRLTVGALEPQFWQVVCDTIERPDLLPTQFDTQAVPVWSALFARRSRDEWLEMFSGRDACVGPVNDMLEALQDPQLVHRGMIVEIEHPTLGSLRQVACPVKLREHPAAIRSAAPRLGESTREVLGKLGYAPAEIDDLVSAGVVDVPRSD